MTRLHPAPLIPQPKKITYDKQGRVLRLQELLAKGPHHALHVQGRLGLAPQAYELSIRPDGIEIAAGGEAAAHYATLTLEQLLSHYGEELPCMVVSDAPDFEHRGFMLDVSRGKVPTMETLYDLIDLLSNLKYNHFQLYIEHVFAFKKHPLPGRGHSPLTAKDLRQLDDYCRERFIEFVPNLQSFGHAWHTLRHKKYAHLAESDFRGGWTLSPVEEGTYELLKDLYEEFLPCFSHKEYFNVGCDETWDLGKGKSAALAKKTGLGAVYTGHLRRVHELVRKHGRRMMFWGDVVAHHPGELGKLPKDGVLLNWGYEAHGQEKDYAKRLRPAARSGMEHWVCPGTSTWNSFFFRLANARVNIRDFALAGRKAGAKGLLLTDWGDHNHYNSLSHALWSIAYGADCAWRTTPDPTADAHFDQRFASVLLHDEEGRLIKPLHLLGGIYETLGVLIPNNSAERWLFTGHPVPDILGVTGELTAYNKIKKTAVRKALREAEEAARLLKSWKGRLPLAERVREDWLMGAELAAHACRRALWHNHGEGDPKALAKEIRSLGKTFERLWLARNRESDLANNRRDFERIEQGYKAKERTAISF